MKIRKGTTHIVIQGHPEYPITDWDVLSTHRTLSAAQARKVWLDKYTSSLAQKMVIPIGASERYLGKRCPGGDGQVTTD